MNVCQSKEIKSGLKSLGTSIKDDIAIPVATIGIIIAGIYYMIGKQEASQKLSMVITGIIIIAIGSGFVSFITGKF